MFRFFIGFFKDHPWLATALSFLIIALPQWLSAVWGLFSSEPMAVVVQRRARAMRLATFSPYWVTVPLGLAMFGLVLYNLTVTRKFSFDYAYGLALQDIQVGYDESTTPQSVQLALILANAADGPIKYEVEQFEVVVEGRTKMKPVFKTRGGVIPRGMRTTFYYPTFSQELPEKAIRLKGMIRYAILYGHPEVGFLRRARKELSFNLRLGEKVGLVYLLENESDEGIAKE